jgi:hypothetical protein
MNWEGRQSVAEIIELTATARLIEVQLAPSYNHALFRHFNPDAQPGAVEELDEQGDTGLLRSIADINGLEDFAALAEPLAEAGASVQVASPPTVIIDLGSESD